MAIRIKNSPDIDKVCIGDIGEDGATWIDDYGNLGILIEDEPFLFQSNRLQKYRYVYSDFADFEVTFIDIEITARPKENEK